MNPKIRSIYALALAASFCLSRPVQAEVELSVALPDFNEGEQPIVYTIGKAEPSKGGIRLTEQVGTSAGAAYYKLPLSMSPHRSFSAYFSFRMTKPENAGNNNVGADGIAFVIQPDLDAIGKSGGGLGYEGIPKSFAVEFDSFSNDGYQDPLKHHIGVNVNGSAKSVATAEVPFTLNDGQIYHAWIDYDGKDDSLQIRLSLSESRPSEPTLKHKIDLEPILGTEQYIGFVASTGTCFEQHDILSLYFNTENFPGGIDISAESYVNLGK